MNETGLGESGGDGREVGSADEHIHILRIAHGRSIDSRDPCGDRVSADNGVIDTSRSESSRGSEESFTDKFHGVHHPLQDVNVRAECGNHVRS